VALSPSAGPPVAAGTQLSYGVSLQNRDSEDCSAARFDLGAAIPAGWQAWLEAPALTLEPGASASTTLSVSSASSAGDGVYALRVDVQNASDPRFAASATATYAVETGTSNQPPVAVDDYVTASGDAPITIEVLANDFDPDGDAIWVTGVGQAAQGSVFLNPDGSVTYQPNGKRRKKGKDSFDYWMTDGFASSTARVRISGKKGRGNGR
jgi:hypothetical protein